MPYPTRYRLVTYGLLAAIIAAGGLGCQREKPPLAPSSAPSVPASSQAASAPRPINTVREAAVAGLFYPREEKTLTEMLDGYLAKASTENQENLRALVCPHAGYEYSGRLAAAAYRHLVGRPIKTVIILAPSHYADFEGAYIPPVDAWRTPLGLVPLSPKAPELAAQSPFVFDPAKCHVQRPEWARQSPLSAPPVGQDRPDTWEHSAEVQVPFLQKVLKDFTIIPIIFGQVDPADVAKALVPYLDDSTLVVASSDLSHFHTYDEAKALDNRCLSALCTMDIEEMKGQEACGKAPILALMYLARLQGWKPIFLGYQNSGDVTGDKNRVVGYGTAAFYQPPSVAAKTYLPAERRQLLGLARQAIREVVVQRDTLKVDESSLPRKFTASKGCFVTLTEKGQLRGCIGSLLPQEALYQAVIDNAKNAALRDPRFPPVRSEELDQIEIEISVLTAPEPLYFSSPRELLDRLQPHVDGVILKIGGRTSTFLPQVWEQLPDKEEFLNALAEKAGCRPDAWKTQPTAVFIYRAEAFKESEK